MTTSRPEKQQQEWYGHQKLKDQAFRIQVLEREVEALRSVLSEWEQDKSCFVQWHTAEAFARVREVIK